MKKSIKTILILSTMATVTIHMLNRFQYSMCNVRNILNRDNDLTYDWRFGRINYTKKGTGSPILMLHDLAVGSSSYEFNQLIDSLAEDHEVYTIDFLGYGKSDKSNMTYTSYLYIQMITDFIKNIICKKTDIIASGESASLSILTCHNDPELIHRILLINPQSLYEQNQIPSKQTKCLKYMIEAPIIGTFVYNLLTTKKRFTEKFETSYFYNKEAIKDQDIYAYMEASHKTDHMSKYSYASYLAKYFNCNIIHALKEINNSIYMIASSELDGNKTTVENYMYYNPAIETSYVSRAKQLVHMERPDKVLRHIKTYLG